MKNTNITIIVATLVEDDEFNSTLNSIVNQKNVSIELIVFIYDENFDLLNPFVRKTQKNHTNITYIRGFDKGIADAWNVSIQYAKGDYLCFLGSGDYFYNEDSMSCFLNCISENILIQSDKKIVYYGNQKIKNNDCSLKDWPLKKNFKKSHLKNGMLIPHASSIWPKSLWLDRRFNGNYRIALDYEFALSVSQECVFLYCDSVVSVITAGGLSNSAKNILAVIKEDRKARIENNYPSNMVTVTNLKRLFKWGLYKCKF